MLIKIVNKEMVNIDKRPKIPEDGCQTGAWAGKTIKKQKPLYASWKFILNKGIRNK